MDEETEGQPAMPPFGQTEIDTLVSLGYDPEAAAAYVLLAAFSAADYHTTTTDAD